MAMVGEPPIELGYRHRSAAVAIDADDDGTMWEDPGEPSGRPGFRAPHVPITVDGMERSTLDLFGRRLVVLAGPDGESWCAAARTASASTGVPLDAHRIRADVTDATGGLQTSYGTGSTGAVLVRPDGFVAWRATASHADPEGELAQALGMALGPRPQALPRTQKRSPRSASSLASCSRWISRTRAGVIASSGETSSISRLVLSS
jgi:putative polyketide hydroxylase